MKSTTPIKDFYNRVIGFIETDDITGDKIGRDFYRRVVGYYDKKSNTTRNFYRRVVGKGDMLSALIIEAHNKRK